MLSKYGFVVTNTIITKIASSLLILLLCNLQLRRYLGLYNSFEKKLVIFAKTRPAKRKPSYLKTNISMVI